MDYDLAPDGWSVGDYLKQVGTITASSCGDVNKDGVPNIVDVNLVIDVAFRNKTYSYNTDVNGSGVTDMIDVAEEIDYVFRGGLEPVGCREQNQTPVIQSFSGPSSVVVGTDNTWSGIATDVDSIGLRYDFTWGDGSPTESVLVQQGTIVDKTHTYNQVGNYTVTFSVIDDRSSSSVSLQAAVTSSSINYPPTINSFSGPSSTDVGQNTTWQVSASDPDNNIWYYHFTWGDGTLPTIIYDGTSSLVSTNHTFNSSGIFDVTLNVFDTFGVNTKTSRSIVVTQDTSSTPNQAPIINSLTGPSSLGVGQAGTWYMTATDPEGTNLRYDFYWDGSCTGSSCVNGYMASEETVSAGYAFSQAGNHAVLGRVDDGGTLVTRTVSVSVTNSTSTSNQVPAPIYYKDPYPIKVSPTKQPLSASVYDSLQQQIDLIYQQLQFLKGQLR